MENKKNLKADVNRKSHSLLWIGLAFALSAVLVAFEYRTTTYEEFVAGQIDLDFLEEEIIPISRIKSPPPPPPPKKQIIDTYEIVDEPVEPDVIPEFVDPKLVPPDEIIYIAPEVEIIDEEKIWVSVEVLPEFPGGEEGFFNYLKNEIKYPKEAKQSGVSGKVYVRFVVGKNGEIIEAQVLHGPGYGLNDEALRVIQAMPAWSPGIQNGHPVKVEFKIPINFR